MDNPVRFRTFSVTGIGPCILCNHGYCTSRAFCFHRCNCNGICRGNCTFNIPDRWYSTVETILVPVAPSGCPSATAPPFILTLSWIQHHWRLQCHNPLILYHFWRIRGPEGWNRTACQCKWRCSSTGASIGCNRHKNSFNNAEHYGK